MVDALHAGGLASEHDAKIARKLAEVLCGGRSGATHEVTEQEILDLEKKQAELRVKMNQYLKELGL